MKQYHILYFLLPFYCSLIVIIATCFALPANAANQVVVVPLISNETKITPINPDDVIEQRRAFTYYSDQLSLGTVTDNRAFIINTITVAPEYYPSTLNQIGIRFCYNLASGSSGCSHTFHVPNNTISKIDFGLGDLFESNGSYYIDIPSRGGLAENVAQQISVFVSGYYFTR